mmetsp:Transcript_26687/g.49977  ORF Transcript_26687/g.49977 Transcript_26687/m.49977 type:complete len:81 (-) Transcript_26687:152-394(-)
MTQLFFLVLVVVVAAVLAESNHLKSVAFDKASSAGCIARFSGTETDTRLRQIGTCDNNNIRQEAVIWPHCEGERCAGEYF